MRLRAVSVSATSECSHHAFQPFAPTVPFSLLSPAVLSNSFVSKTLLKSPSFNKVSRGHSHTIRRSCSSNLDGIYRNDDPSFRVEGLGMSSNECYRKNKKLHFAISKNGPFSDDKRLRDQDSFLNSRIDFLEPMMLGIRPEFPDWPDQETIMWATIEQKAKSLDIPLSLRMIKKKLQWEEGLVDSKESAYCSVKTAFASMVFIIVELQSCALHMTEDLCDEDLEIITNKVQKEMHSSFVWLFEQVFSRTPDLMLNVMILLANFGVCSVSHNVEIRETSLSRTLIQQYPQINSSLSSLEMMQTGNLSRSTEHSSMYPCGQLESVAEMNLWNSMVDDATKTREVKNDLDQETTKYFVSPVSVELEPDDYEDYLRTDLLYQMNVSQDPNNPLFLCNYAQFLHLVARDYDRAEECFKRAVQVMPPDSESLSQYANFLWTVRKDYLGAEESYLQGLTLEPDNSYYASRYANFLWSTGGEETCFPLNNSNSRNL
ncbi:hypothetical protein ACS0TY_032970 [Phlomoides rotata]